jgi:hypothetical protein
MEARVISKVSRRIVPFVALCYFLCYLDRVNVGFAALQMNNDLGFTATMFGWGAGIFQQNCQSRISEPILPGMGQTSPVIDGD